MKNVVISRFLILYYFNDNILATLVNVNVFAFNLLKILPTVLGSLITLYYCMFFTIINSKEKTFSCGKLRKRLYLLEVIKCDFPESF